MPTDELQAILKKDPVIYTFTAKQLTEDPRKVDERYTVHAKTHMTLGDTKELEERVLSWLITNQGTLVGGVTGEYGMGKTSILIHLWKKCEEQGLLSVPPYVWLDFASNLDVAYSWAKYRLQQSPPALEKLEQLYSRYRAPLEASLAREATQRHGIDYDKAVGLVAGWLAEEKLTLDLAPERYLDFLAELAVLVTDAGLFKGVVVFTDELQVTVEKLSLRKCADILFRLASSLNERTGPYGFMVGIPRDTQGQLLAERSDIFVRLQKCRCFLDLASVYGRGFPRDLWRLLCERFELKDIESEVMKSEVLDALGDISHRPDLGNGPRSVVSAFNRIVHRYVSSHKTYELANLVDDCLSQEIVLSGPTYATRVRGLLGEPFAVGLEGLIKLLAAFPSGCPQDLVEGQGYAQALEELSQKAFGSVLRETPNGYALVALSTPSGGDEKTAVEREVQSYYRSYAGGAKELRDAVDGFRGAVVPHLFPTRTGQQIHGWECGGSHDWTWNRFGSDGFAWTIGLAGTFERSADYPARSIRLFICDEKTPKVRKPTEDEHFVVVFRLLDSDTPGSVVVSDDNQCVIFRMGLGLPIADYRIKGVSPDLLPRKLMTPAFLLGLVAHLRSRHTIPKHEEPLLGTVISDIAQSVTAAMFASSLVSDLEARDIEVSNEGRLLVSDLFRELCVRRFPDYATLITQPQWEKKLEDYVSALERVPRSAARGREPIDRGMPNADDNRREAAKLFNLGLGSFNIWAEALGSLFDLAEWKSAGRLRFKVHPLEREILQLIDQCPDEKGIVVAGKRCKRADGKEVVHRCLRRGYTNPEILFVMKRLGAARGFFKFDADRYFVYYEPLELEELKAQLEGTLEGYSMQSEAVADILGLRNTPLDTDPAIFRSDIAKVTGQDDFDVLAHKLEILKIRLCGLISGKLEELARRVESEQSTLADATTATEASSEAGALKRKLEGQASWLPEITRIQISVRGGLDQSLLQLRRMAKGLVPLITRLRKTANDKAALEVCGHDVLIEGSNDVISRLEEGSNGRSDLKHKLQYASSFTQWQTVLSASDAAWQSVLECQRFGGKGLVEEHVKVSKEIAENLKSLDRDGLKDWELYRASYEALRKRADGVVGEARRKFLQQKEELLRLLKESGSRVSLLRTSFDAGNPAESFEALFDEAWGFFAETIQELSKDVAEFKRDLEYIGSVLDRGRQVEESGLTQSIDQLADSISPLADIPIVALPGATTLTAELKRLGCSYAEALSQLRQKVAKPEPPTDDELRILKLFNKQQDMDLREVILEFADSEGNLDLEHVLEVTKRLFRKGLISIKMRKLS